MPKVPLPSFPGKDDEDYEDVFEEMTLAEHLDELRSRLVKTCVGIGIAFIGGLFLTRPLLGLVRDNANIERFDVIDATEPITSFFKTALYIAIAVALPLIFYQIFAFVSPGLTRKEKRYVYGSLPFVVVFFLAGAAFAFFLAIPRAFEVQHRRLQQRPVRLFPDVWQHLAFCIQVSLGSGNHVRIADHHVPAFSFAGSSGETAMSASRRARQ
ncbi:MAG: twin-arginine translocase subunit TatC [Thermomicrobiales bacterium]